MVTCGNPLTANNVCWNVYNYQSSTFQTTAAYYAGELSVGGSRLCSCTPCMHMHCRTEPLTGWPLRPRHPDARLCPILSYLYFRHVVRL